MIKNDGTVPQYYVENSHEAIVSDEVFDMVQAELEKRKKEKMSRPSEYFFSGRLICGCCGRAFTRKVWHSNSKYRRVIWQCGQKYSNKEKCTSTHLYEGEIKEAFVHWVNDLIKNKPEVIQSCEQVLEEVMATEKLETEIQELEDKSSELFKKLREMLKSGGKDPDIEALMKSSFKRARV